MAERDAEFSSVLSAFDTPNEALSTEIKLFTRRSLATRAWWGSSPSSKTTSSSYQGDRQLDDHLLDVDGDCMGPRPTYNHLGRVFTWRAVPAELRARSRRQNRN